MIKQHKIDDFRFIGMTQAGFEHNHHCEAATEIGRQISYLYHFVFLTDFESWGKLIL